LFVDCFIVFTFPDKIGFCVWLMKSRMIIPIKERIKKVFWWFILTYILKYRFIYKFGFVVFFMDFLEDLDWASIGIKLDYLLESCEDSKRNEICVDGFNEKGYFAGYFRMGDGKFLRGQFYDLENVSLIPSHLTISERKQDLIEKGREDILPRFWKWVSYLYFNQMICPTGIKHLSAA